MSPQSPNVGRLVTAVLVVACLDAVYVDRSTPPEPVVAGDVQKANEAGKTSGQAMSGNNQIPATREGILVAELTLPSCGITQGNG